MRPAPYESAALPTELNRHADLAGHKQPNPDCTATTAPRRVSDGNDGEAGDTYHASAGLQRNGRAVRRSAYQPPPLPRGRQGGSVIHPAQLDGMPSGVDLSVVYAIGVVDGLTKFGTTTNLRKRFAALQTSSPVLLTCFGWFPGGPSDERIIHDLFAPERMHGEWFRRTPDVAAFLADFSAAGVLRVDPARVGEAWIGGGLGYMTLEGEKRLGFWPRRLTPAAEQLLSEGAR